MPPSAPDSRAFRRTIGLFATGVAVLTTYNQEGGCVCMTANSVTSVSLDPLLVLVCVWKDARITPHLLEAEGFALSILGADQEALSQYFAGLWDANAAPPAFSLTDWGTAPRREGCIAALSCLRHAVYDGGDHWIVLGRVIDLYRPDTLPDPLIFYGGAYRRLTPKEG
ncbi:MAG: flavin reductase family protein [Anaerolineae bacterium]